MKSYNSNKRETNFYKKRMTNVILKRKGYKTTIKVIELLLSRPFNNNQIANTLGVDYNTVRYHLDLLVKNNLLMKDGDQYGTLYYPTIGLKENLDTFKKLKDQQLIEKK